MSERSSILSSTDSDYIIFADESGDHSLTSINPDYPIFVLCFCIVRKDYYIEQIVPEVHRIKMRYFGHDQVVFHERDFVKRTGDFGALPKNIREGLLAELTAFMSQAEMKLVAAVIRKKELVQKYASPFNPYDIGLQFCLELTHDFLRQHKQNNRLTHIIAESRGKIEDKKLKDEFNQIIDGRRCWGWVNPKYSDTPMSLYCSSKGSNSSGMQIADLTARPIGLSVLRENQQNRAFEIIRGKIWGMQSFPKK